MISPYAMTEYEISMQSAERRVFHLLHSIEWQLLWEKNYDSVWVMRCNITENNMYRYEGIIRNRTPTEVAIVVHPEGSHRANWDSQSAGTSMLTRIREDTVIIRHDTKPRMMGLIAGRDTIDLCRFSTNPNNGL
uniref:START domain-containing protein n=1 Tax=Heterorhabditis bacteriophora TaxID=37862 RepID=A0A1I7XRJ7_HETBA